MHRYVDQEQIITHHLYLYVWKKLEKGANVGEKKQNIILFYSFKL